jgi:6-phosphogluconolactonase
MAREALLDRVIPGSVHRIQGELGHVEAADAYEHDLRVAGPPEFDLLLLGLGPDGHLASLFPGQPTLSERSRLAVGVPEAGLEPFVPRVTMTLPALASAKRIVFLVSGDSKADAVAAAFGPDARPDPNVPASLLPPLTEEVTVLLDEPAGAKVRR